MNDPFASFIRDLRQGLGWQRVFARRALREVRDHLEDAATAREAEGATREDARRHAVAHFGSVQETVRMITELNRGIRMVDRMGGLGTLAVLFLLAPSVALMGVSVLTYNADLAPLRALTGPLHLLDWKFIWLRVLLTIALPMFAAGAVTARAVRVRRTNFDGDNGLGIFVVNPTLFFCRMSVVALVMIAVFIYY